jgi:sugar lactone lactonase YvrE
MFAAYDAKGNLYIPDSFDHRVRKVSAQGVIGVVAGTGKAGYSGDGGPATAAELDTPTALSIDGSGNLYIADTHNNVIREVIAATGVIQTVAGNGTLGYSGDGGAATSATLDGPEGVFITSTGILYLSDTSNCVIRKVTAGTIQTVAGMGPTNSGYSGDGGPATSAKLNLPMGLSVDPSGNIFFADSSNQVIREVIAATGIIQTVAGNGVAGFAGDGGLATSAQLHKPLDVSLDGSGNLFIADSLNEVVRKVSGGNIQTVAGTGLSAGYSGDGGLATSAKLSNPSRVFIDSSGNFYISDTLNFVIREVTAGTIDTIAGNGLQRISGNGYPPTDAFLETPWGVVLDPAGNLFFTAWDSQVVGKISASTGKLQILAGNGIAGFAGDDGPATGAQFTNPCGLALDASGNIYISDENNHRIRKIDAATGIIHTIAGTGVLGYSGDGGPATSAQLGWPTAIFVDALGNVFFGDQHNHVIREITAADGNIKTVAGTGTPGFSGDGGPATSAELNQPFGVYVDAAGNLFISDSGNSRIREVTASNGIIQTVAGNGTFTYSGDGGPALSAGLNGPDNVVLDAAGNIFIADVFNNAIREVVASTGNIMTVAGNGTADFSGDGGPATQATIDYPASVTVDSSGNFILADMNNDRIRSVSALATVANPVANLSATSLTFAAQTIRTTSAPQTVTLTNNSTQALTITSIVASGTNPGDFRESDTCSPSVAAGGQCIITVTFTPAAAGNRTASIVLTDNASDSPQSIQLSGTGTAIATSTSVISSLNPSTFGQSVTFTATVSVVAGVINPTSNARVTPQGVVGYSGPTGTVTFLDGTTHLGTGTLDSTGHATYATSTLSAGTHPITAQYGGDSAYAASTSAALSQVVNANDFALASSTPTQTVSWGNAANYTITVTPQPQGGTFTGTIALSAAGLPAGATAIFTPSSVASPSGATNVTMTIQTPAKAAVAPMILSRGPHARFPLFAVPFLALGAIWVARLLKRFASDSKLRTLLPRPALLLLCFSLAGALLSATGCNGGFSAPPSSPQSSSYTVTVTASSGALQHTASVTLTVQ